AAHATMVLLHDRYAIDGRDPNTHAGILWCFGKHDRPWAPERPIFGIIRYMSSESSARKVRLKEIEEAVVTCGGRSRLSKKLL
ncbi:MAG: deoxyribodipyrimidine photolyase, partial [Thermoanaerobaculia bacterium]